MRRLRARDLNCASRSGVVRRFVATLVEVEPRRTLSGRPWAVVTFVNRSVGRLRCPVFPTRWSQSPDLVLGHRYHAVGTVSFRDGIPAIGVLKIDEAHLRSADAAGLPGDHVQHA